MLNKIRHAIYRMLAGKRFASDDELYLYLILQVAVVFAGGMHLLLLIITSLLGVGPLALVNVVSVPLYAFVLLLVNKKRTYTFAGILIAVEVLSYSLLSALCVGNDDYVILYFFVLLVMQLTIPYASARLRVVISAAIWAALIAYIVIGEYWQPLIALGGKELVMSVFNIHLAFFGTVLELSIGNSLRQIIADYNAGRLAEYKNRANTDQLTGLHNRWYAQTFFERIRREQEGRPWCVAMVDIDDFKVVNDSMGHAVGDVVLAMLAETMRANLRKSDMLFRWGGEEFLLFLAEVEVETAGDILEKLRRLVADSPVHADGNTVAYTVTIGVAPLDPEDIEAGIALCDARLYSGKTSGKNKVVWR